MRFIDRNKNSLFQVPILFLIFNRPELTRLVFNKIKVIKPKKLYVSADGPRLDRVDDIESCRLTRSILDEINWDCEVYTNFSEFNLGCKKAVSQGISWFFVHVEEGIILEDDCVPDESFFPFCEELLEKYRHDTRVMMISGANFHAPKSGLTCSYSFSMHNIIWGWATWRRAWKYYDVDIVKWPEIRAKDYLNDVLRDGRLVRIFKNSFDKVYEKKIDTWDFQWNLACWMQQGVSILPVTNLVKNHGCQANATHTTSIDDERSNLPTFPIQFPIIHPEFLIIDRASDCYIFNQYYSFLLFKRIKRRLKSIFSFVN